jgi:hypothetical protein
MAVMAIEAAKQMAENQRILAYEIKDLVIDSALNLSSNQDGIETDFYLRSNRNAVASSKWFTAGPPEVQTAMKDSKRRQGVLS